MRRNNRPDDILVLSALIITMVVMFALVMITGGAQ